jgi:XisI protein
MSAKDRYGDYAMESLEGDRSLIESILIEYTKIPYAYGDFQTEAIFDRVRDRYVLMNVGWDDGKRVHGSLIHVDIIDGKFWIQRDGIEHGIVTELLDAGIPKERIVMAYKPIERRRLMEFAVN